MGNSNKKSVNVLVVGLDNSGKSTIINSLKPEKEKKMDTVATVGFQIEKLKHGNCNFTMFDMSGQGRYRTLWEKYFSESQGIIFVLDSADSLRVCVAKDELAILLKHQDIKNNKIPILFFANKMDIENALTPAELSDALELNNINDRPWCIQPSNAIKGNGLQEGMKWLEEKLGV